MSDVWNIANFRLILARMRFESKGGRLPGSSGPIAASPTSKTPSGKKRALPTWGGGGTGGGGGGGGGGSASGRPKRETPPWNATPSPTGPSLFTPSYTAKPSPGNQRGAASPPAAAFTATADARPTSKASEPWTSSMVLGAIKKAGPSGITLQVSEALRALPPLRMYAYIFSSFFSCFCFFRKRLLFLAMGFFSGAST